MKDMHLNKVFTFTYITVLFADHAVKLSSNV